MTTEYVVEAAYQGGMHFSGTIGGRACHMDYPLGPDDAMAGPRPMDMLLASLASCVGGSVAALMRPGRARARRAHGRGASERAPVGVAGVV